MVSSFYSFDFRSKKECMKRYKDLVETVKAKKAAIAASAAATAAKS